MKQAATVVRMASSTFQRARSEEQRAQRRATILAAASDMLRRMPVASVSLNELSRRVGLAKSNVLRYFESREAILLDLLDAELHDWATKLERTLTDADAGLDDRVARLARSIAKALSARPIMCDLISAQTAVLERNISTEVALRHKHHIAREVAIITGAITRVVPELDESQAYQIVAHTLLMTAGAWPQSQPSPALQAAYDSDPAVAATQMDFTDVVADTIKLTATGLLHTQAFITPAVSSTEG